MPVNLNAPDPATLHAVPGVRLGITMAGIRKADRRDLSVIALDEGASVAGVFTSNRFCAAPVQICRQHLAGVAAGGAGIRAILVNTGNANAGTGADGLARAQQSCQALAQLMGVQPEQILPFSTGVIMETLPVDRIIAGLPAAIAAMRAWFATLQGVRLVAIGHRVVHGMEINQPVLLTEAAIEKIRQAAVLAPLHNPPGLQGGPEHDQAPAHEPKAHCSARLPQGLMAGFLHHVGADPNAAQC